MIVCIRRRISDREIARHAHAGMRFDGIELGVATHCGQCEASARDVVAQSGSHCTDTNTSLAANLAQG